MDRSLAVIRTGTVNRIQADKLREEWSKLAVELFWSEAASAFELFWTPHFKRVIRQGVALAGVRRRRS